MLIISLILTINNVELYLIFHDEEVSGQFLFLILLGIKLVDSGSEVGGISSEGDTHKSQELVHTGDQILRAVSNTVSTGSTFVNDNPILTINSRKSTEKSYKSAR